MSTPVTPPPRPSFLATLLSSSARGLTLFLGGFTLLNILGDLRTPGFNANEWWIDLGQRFHAAKLIFLALAALLLLAHAIRPFRALPLRRALRLTLAILFGVSLANILLFFRLARSGQLHQVFPIPFSAFIALALLWLYLDARHARPTSLLKALPIFLACLFAFPLLQMLCFGKTDYRRHADAIIVFGARAYADGRPSDALRDRTRTAVTLYQQGYAPLLIFSGGPGDGPVHEVESMRNLALSLGVPESAIILDYDGLNTDHTVDNTAVIFGQHQIKSALAVSHFYHLPRVKMTYRRAGLEVYTVPAYEPRPLAALPTLMTREIAALWAYYLRPLAG